MVSLIAGVALVKSPNKTIGVFIAVAPLLSAGCWKLDCIEAQGGGRNHDGWCLGEVIAVDWTSWTMSRMTIRGKVDIVHSRSLDIAVVPRGTCNRSIAIARND